MDTKALLKKVRKIEIKTRRLSDHLFSGAYHTSFKGRGMTFAEVRQYQFGDDVRAIDWNVTARYNEPYVKVFEEERELTMMLMVDISGSSHFGTDLQRKRDTVTEIAATLAFSASQNNDKIGLVLFTDRIELYIPPKKGKSHVLRLIRELLEFQPQSRGTHLGQAFEFMAATQKKKCIAFVVSDFITDVDYEKSLKMAARKHDITGVRVYDQRDAHMPNVGLVDFEDAETGQIRTVDTSAKAVRLQYEADYRRRVDQFKDVFARCGLGTIHNRVDESYVTKLLQYFQSR